jgi:hypothetical protein
MNWINLVQDMDLCRVLGKKDNKPSGSIKCREVLE